MEALSFVPTPPEVNNFRQGCDFGQFCHETLLFPRFMHSFSSCLFRFLPLFTMPTGNSQITRYDTCLFTESFYFRLTRLPCSYAFYVFSIFVLEHFQESAMTILEISGVLCSFEVAFTLSHWSSQWPCRGIYYFLLTPPFLYLRKLRDDRICSSL